ncbi:MAG: PIG-L family deacetylase [Chloroflexi bacterium]|nr:PIG-L family deacetylase [Chloroflexota bacterium]
MPAVRAQELCCACTALGIEPPRLLDYRDGTLAEVDEEEAVERVLVIVRELRPQVLLTWPPDGLSGHPDHIAVSRWTALAFQRAAALGSAAPTALYHLAVPRSVVQALGLSHLHATPDGEITLTVDVSPVWEQKLAAIRCHRTQLGGSPILTAPPERQHLFLGTEHFRRAQLRAEGDLLSDFLMWR